MRPRPPLSSPSSPVPHSAFARVTALGGLGSDLAVVSLQISESDSNQRALTPDRRDVVSRVGIALYGYLTLLALLIHGISANSGPCQHVLFHPSLRATSGICSVRAHPSGTRQLSLPRFFFFSFPCSAASDGGTPSEASSFPDHAGPWAVLPTTVFRWTWPNRHTPTAGKLHYGPPMFVCSLWPCQLTWKRNINPGVALTASVPLRR